MKLADADQSYSHSLPSIDFRTGQARLVYAGFGPLNIDGISGQATVKALIAFQKSKGLQQNGDFDGPTNTALKAAAGV